MPSWSYDFLSLDGSASTTPCQESSYDASSSGVASAAIFIMCQYYAHAFTCKHLSFTFARFCQPASLIQKPCTKRQVWQTIGLDDACEECLTWFPDQYPCRRPRYQ
ncbi:hypothetical protein HER10_EVM0006785 [Colletotrichum scovillei]|uniref:uncharacterized protein n=1 Tax=Colletotrichum scovillei TaxID=1209932 RepID=UPI0015C2CA77|nr:uncharacterized protein HER10_EVM0006785 [Colletotrichum scovillei]KAF4779799.1 hypothetical protein HER10_EVM0006785 [Colletotrichum scovillei]